MNLYSGGLLSEGFLRLTFGGLIFRREHYYYFLWGEGGGGGLLSEFYSTLSVSPKFSRSIVFNFSWDSKQIENNAYAKLWRDKTRVLPIKTLQTPTQA